MKKLLLISLWLISPGAFAQLNIQPKTTAAQWDSVVRYGFFNEPPSTVLPVAVHSLSNVTFRGGSEGFAYFIDAMNPATSTAINFTEGIILMSGNSSQINNAANAVNAADPVPPQGDPDLQLLSSSGITDVAVLEFDFVPKTDTIKFKYRFASEEYPEYVCCQFTDVFGFFITGPNPAGGVYNAKNFALIPGTTMPVGVNSVNPGVTGANCTGSICNLANQSLAYSAFYQNNQISTNIVFDGITVELEVVIPVKICGEYHLKLAVGDASDASHDSGVFLKARSFKGGLAVPYDTSSASNTPTSSVVCAGDSVTLIAPNAVSYDWDIATTREITVGPGTYTCVLYNTALSPMCFLTSVNYYVLAANPIAVIDTVGLTSLCAGDSVQLVSMVQAPGSTYMWSNGETNPYTWIDFSETGSYTLTVTDSTGTCDSVSAAVTILPATASATIIPQGGVTSICPGGSVTLTASPAGTGYLWSNGATTQSITVGAAGNYIVTVDNGLCDALSPPLEITESIPDVQIANTGPLVFCQGGSVVLSATPGYNGYSWTGGAGDSVIVVSSPGIYQVTVTDSVGCTDSASVTVTVNAASASIAAVADTVLCPGDSILLSASAGSGWTWNTGAVTQSIYVKSQGSYFVEILNLNGCSGLSDTVDIYMSTAPGATIVSPGADTTICAGDNVSIVAGPGASYSWSTGSGLSTISLTPLTDDIYTVIVTSVDGCLDTAAISVDVSYPVADITNTGDTIFCIGNSVTLNANAGSSWNWSNGLVSQSVTVSNPGIYSVIVTDQFGCTAADEMLVTVNEADAQISPAAGITFCDGDSVQLSNVSLNTASVQWSNGATANSIWVTDGVSYSFTVTDINGCTDVSSAVVNIVSVPQASVSPSGTVTICENADTVLTANQGSAYLWSTGAIADNITVSGTGNYSVSVQVTDSIGCVATSQVVNIVTSYPVASIVSPSSSSFDLCPNESVTLEASAGSYYIWSNNATTSSITVNTAGSYFVDIINAFNCSARSQTITVNQLESFADTASSGPLQFCEGGSVTLTSTTPGTYLWSNGETTASITTGTSGAYSVIVTNLNNCTATSPVFNVVSHPYPVISFTADSSSECEAFKIKFNNYSQYANGSTFLWNFGDSTSSAGASPTHWYTDNGIYIVTLYIETPFGCSSIDSNEVEIVRYPDPVARFEISPAVENVYAGPIAFTNLSVDASRYHWDFGDNSGSTEVNPVHDYREPGYYMVVLTAFNPADCEDKSQKEVAIAPLFIPSAFTPNGDGKNDYFPGVMPEGMEVKDFELAVFNRWGERIFVSDSPYKHWNGDLEDGHPATADSYIYRIEIKDNLNKVFSLNGTFTIVR